MELKIRMPFMSSGRTGGRPSGAAAKKKGEGSRVAQTFALAGLLFVIPLSLSAFNYVRTALKDIAFAEAERIGMEYLRPAQETLSLLQRHAGLSRAFIAGDTQAMGPLQETGNRIRAAMEKVDGADRKNEGALGVADSWGKIKQSWGKLNARGQALSDAQSVEGHQQLIDDVTRFIQDVGDRSNLILDPDLDSYYLMDLTILRLPHLTGTTAKAVSTGVAGAAAKSLTFDQKLELAVFADPAERDGILDSLGRAYKANGALRGKLDTTAQQAIKAVEELQEAVRKSFLQGEAASADLHKWTEAADPISAATLAFAAAAQTQLDDLLTARIDKLQQSLYIQLSVIAVATTLALGLLVFLARRSAAQVQGVADENQRNQAAVMRFMNELAEVADGNLKTKISVTDDITGTIADMVNSTVEELHRLVVGINQAAAQVATSSTEARQVAEGTLSVTEQQAQEVRGSAETVTLLATSIQEVSSSATRSADVARRSISTAEQGTVAVKNTIVGMNGLREQIQETSKRIKRLGESSQEIGEIVNLLSDLTEQTNVLALNAAIQAAAAGEAGKGFSVVAEEVQRLAERSAEATRQIGAIINTIQTDTKDTISAMERSTQGVVDGTRLSDDAGRALGEIEHVTGELAELIHGIAVKSQQQSQVAGGVAENMHRVLGLTDKSSQATQRTASSVGRLSELAEELKVSVAGFKV